MSKTIKYLLLTIILAAPGIIGCFNDEKKDNPLASYLNLYQDQETNGHLKLYITDAPVDADNINGVYIAIREIQYKQQEEWKTFDGLDYPLTYNLLELSGGKSAMLADISMPAGQYNQIRFLLEGPDEKCCKIQPNPGSYISFTDDTTEPLFIPSGSQTGYKAIGVFRVPVNGVVEITADFDVRKGLVQANGRYILKPTIRLIVNNEAGRISGSIINNSGYTDIIVYAYEDGTWSDTEDDDPADGENRFPGSKE